MSDNKSDKITCLVSISDQVFFSMVTASLEAYKVRHTAVIPSDHEPVETYGNIWGYITKKKPNLSVIRAVFADVDTSADRYNDSAVPKTEAFELKRDFVNTYLPELEYIGDFHSHPYSFNGSDKVRSVPELERYNFYNFSKNDVAFYKNLQKTEGRNFKVAFAVTVYEMDKKVTRQNCYLDNFSCIRFMYDKIAIYIKTYAYIKSDGSRVPSKNVALQCPTIGFTGLCQLT
jgi:hypothetical protein